MDYRLDWTDQNSCKQMVNSPKLQWLSPPLYQVASYPWCFVASVSERSKIVCILNKIQLWLNLCEFWTGFGHPWIVCTVCYWVHMHLLRMKLCKALIELQLEFFSCLKDRRAISFEQKPNSSFCLTIKNRTNIPLSAEAHEICTRPLISGSQGKTPERHRKQHLNRPRDDTS